MTPFRYAAQAQRHCPGDVVLWLDFRKGIYYSKRQRRYVSGFTGSFVCREEARGSGYRCSACGSGLPEWALVSNLVLTARPRRASASDERLDGLAASRTGSRTSSTISAWRYSLATSVVKLLDSHRVSNGLRNGSRSPGQQAALPAVIPRETRSSREGHA